MTVLHTTRATQQQTRALPSLSDDAQGAARTVRTPSISPVETNYDETVVEQPIADAQPAQGKTEDIDPETRMLQQIAALKADEARRQTEAAASPGCGEAPTKKPQSRNFCG